MNPSVTSPYSTPILFVTKKNDGLRLCVDFRKLNSVTIHGVWQIEVKEEDRKKTALTCEFGHYEFNRLAFGLRNAPVSFQTTMNVALDDVLYHHAMD